mgnify:CR=1 FL=1
MVEKLVLVTVRWQLTCLIFKEEAFRPTPKWNTRFFFAFSKRTQLWLPKVWRKWENSFGKAGKREWQSFLIKEKITKKLAHSGNWTRISLVRDRYHNHYTKLPLICDQWNRYVYIVNKINHKNIKYFRICCIHRIANRSLFPTSM